MSEFLKIILQKRPGFSVRCFCLFTLYVVLAFAGDAIAATSSPIITSVTTTPLSVSQGMSVNMTLDGSSFQSGAALSFLPRTFLTSRSTRRT